MDCQCARARHSVEKRKIPDSPRTIGHGFYRNSKLLCGLRHVGPPCIYIVHEEAHDEVTSVLGYTKILQEKSRGTITEASELRCAPLQLKADYLIEELGKLEVFGGNESLDLDTAKLMHFVGTFTVELRFDVLPGRGTVGI